MRTERPGSAAGARRIAIMRVMSPRAADGRVGPAPLTHAALLRRGMRCVQWLAKRQRERGNILKSAPFTI
jgi:hypothetical protein